MIAMIASYSWLWVGAGKATSWGLVTCLTVTSGLLGVDLGVAFLWTSWLWRFLLKSMANVAVTTSRPARKWVKRATGIPSVAMTPTLLAMPFTCWKRTISFMIKATTTMANPTIAIPTNRSHGHTFPSSLWPRMRSHTANHSPSMASTWAIAHGISNHICVANRPDR